MGAWWAIRMALEVFAVHEGKGQEEAPWEEKKIVWGVLHDATEVPVDAMALRLKMTPVKREKGRDIVLTTEICHEASSLEDEPASTSCPYGPDMPRPVGPATQPSVASMLCGSVLYRS